VVEAGSVKPTRSDRVSDEELARRGLSRETEIRLDARGRFFSAGELVDHPGICGAFARWIERTEAGRYVLRNDLHYVYLTVEGAPLHARGAHVEDTRVVLELQGGVEEILRPATLRSDREGVLYADGRDGTWPIRLAPAASMALEPLLEQLEGRVVLRLGEAVFEVRSVDDPLQPTPTAAP
jgi:hypothetical protein